VTWVKVEPRLVHLEIVLISAQDRCVVCAKCTMAWKSFWAQAMVLLGDVGQVEAHFSPFGNVLMLAQDRCTVCAKCTMAMEIILGTHDGTPR
jgi:hypothetical protein